MEFYDWMFGLRLGHKTVEYKKGMACHTKSREYGRWKCRLERKKYVQVGQRRIHLVGKSYVENIEGNGTNSVLMIWKNLNSQK